MGYGPSPAPKRTWKQVLLPEHGTYMEFQKLKRAEKEKKKQEMEGGESLTVVPEGQFAQFDQFTRLLEEGAELAKNQRKWLVGIPVFLMFCSGGAFGTAGYLVFSEGLKGVPAADVVKNNGHIVQLAIVALCFTMVCLCASISPTSVKQIYYTNIGLVTYFAICGAILCPFAMPLLLPDRTGMVYTLWMICGAIKCYGYILACIWAVCTQPPRKCLRIMEWGLMVVIVGIGLFTAAANYFCMLDYGATLPPHWFRSYVIMSLTCVVIGYFAVTDVPRSLGKAFLVFLHRIQSPGTSFDQQVLAATITIMVGADSGFREILSQALGALRCVSMADVTWDEFKENTPNPKCYDKSRAATFKGIDFFVSHSWSDDPHAKWQAVQKMRDDFKKAHKREPLVWFDKYCIDQNAIDQSVRRLPIFVVASSKFYVLLGPSYATRCWCMLELFVFKACQRCGLFSDAEVSIAEDRVDELCTTRPPCTTRLHHSPAPPLARTAHTSTFDRLVLCSSSSPRCAPTAPTCTSPSSRPSSRSTTHAATAMSTARRSSALSRPPATATWASPRQSARSPRPLGRISMGRCRLSTPSPGAPRPRRLRRPPGRRRRRGLCASARSRARASRRRRAPVRPGM